MTITTEHTDINAKGWIAHLPEHLRPYALLMRLDRPIGTWLLLLPAWWSILAATHGLTDFSASTASTLILFGTGALVMRGAGCVVNDLWDRDFDARVERTKNRPLASKQISMRQAVFFLGSLLGIGLAILLSFNTTTIILGFVSLIPVIIYPLAKRVTWYPQAVLGLTFNFGALMGAAAILNDIPPFAWALYAAGFFWTLGYDTIYARQDIADDALIGVKSTARKFGNKVKTYVAVFYSLTIALIFVAGILANVTAVFYGVMSLGLLHLLWQVRTWDKDDPQSSLQKFRSNRDFALVVTTAFLFGFM
ncbi:MAG TPA: 4-hydroxybenzoate octaprenyltransferase [Alphaproteobacteria bacterium]|nr:4-hydroxybenzoate octaprenyltransferase [Alphaproteobacteria bacterium]HNS45131.1 4-hydroxybenzoate octaprenyltransferase [Alphaproteobacteria bacterium]